MKILFIKMLLAYTTELFIIIFILINLFPYLCKFKKGPTITKRGRYKPMQTINEKKIPLEEKRLELIKGLMQLQVKYITKYENYEIDGILQDIESDLKEFYNKNTKCFGLRLKNNIMLYIFEFNCQEYALVDLDGEIISSTINNTMREGVALKELYDHCKKETTKNYNENMEKLDKIIKSI